MNDANLRARLQDLREAHSGDPDRGANAFATDAWWRDQHGAPRLEGRDAIRANFAALVGDVREWDPTEVVVERDVALVRFRFTLGSSADRAIREGWARLDLGDEHLRSWDAIWTPGHA